MRSKNHRALTALEQAHVARVKEMSCGVCGTPGPSDAHHLEQQHHFTVIPLCPDCHRGQFNGLHGQRRMWAVMKATELSVLNETIRQLVASSTSSRPITRPGRPATTPTRVGAAGSPGRTSLAFECSDDATSASTEASE